MGQVTMQQALYIARETTQLADPSADGSSMYPVPFSELSGSQI